MRRLAVTCLLVLLARPAWATDCTYPNPVDQIPPVGATTQVKPSWNRVICVLNRLAAQLAGLPTLDAVCSTLTIEVGAVQTVTLTLAHALSGTDVITPSVADSTSPGRLQAISVHGSGTQANVEVWNRDAYSPRSGRVCVTVRR